MKNYNCPNCIKTGKPIADAIICLRCDLHRKGQCSPIENDLYRQTGNGYELYYPIQKIIRKVASYLGISTKDVIEILEKRYKLKIGRTTILKYQKMGLLNQVEKIGRGKAKGVYSIWDDETPLKFYFINHLKNKGITLNEFKKYQDIVQIKKPQELKKYRFGPASVLAYADDFGTRIDIMKFFTVLANLAAVKLKVTNPSSYDPKIILDEKNLNNSRIEVTLINEVPDKKVIFTKDGAKVESKA